MTDRSHDAANTITYPPLIYAAGIALGWLIDRLIALPFVPQAWSRPLGWLLVLGGSAIDGWSSLTMLRSRTTLDPYGSTSTIVQRGPYRYSRNPIYVGYTVLYLGVALLRRSLPTLLLLPIVLIVMRRGVIDREERYLTRAFGRDYTKYTARVRRWL